jgi:hypothetical protein
MGFRFQRRIRIGPGLRINLSKSGVSTSVGTKGAWFTAGPRGARTTAGIPGTGMSYTETSRSRSGVGAVLILAFLVLLAFAMFGM